MKQLALFCMLLVMGTIGPPNVCALTGARLMGGTYADKKRAARGRPSLASI